MKKLSSLLASLALSTVLAASCLTKDPATADSQPGTPQTPVQEEYTLPLIETTDIHGYEVYTDNSAVHYRLAYIADKAEDLRKDGVDRLLLLDGGDLYQGASVSNLTKGWPIYVSVDKMGYDAVTVGNHEFDWGIENLIDPDATLPDYEWEGQSCSNQVPVVCANLYKDGSRVSFTRDCVVVEKSAVSAFGEVIPVKIGIIGFAVDYSGSILTTQFKGKGFSIQADYSIANHLAASLESSGACDATILLIHGAADEIADRLGPDSPIDLVLGGHSHRTLFGNSTYGLPYLQGGRYAEHYAYAELKFTVDGEGKPAFSRVHQISNYTVDATRDTDVEENADDLSEEILAISKAALSSTEAAQKDVIGHIGVSASSYYINGSDGRAATISNWMCDILRRIGEADVAFVNAGGIRATFPLNGSATRDITVANVYEMFPFSNTTYVYGLTYADLLTVFQYAMTTGGQALFSRVTGLDCFFTKTDHGSYYTYAVYALRKDGTVIYQNGTWTGDWASRSVTLAVSEYLATTERTDYYTNLPNPLIEWNQTDKLLRNDLVDNDNAVRILREEAAANGGLLYIDNATHFILK